MNTLLFRVPRGTGPVCMLVLLFAAAALAAGYRLEAAPAPPRAGVVAPPALRGTPRAAAPLPLAPVVETEPLNPGSTVERDLCLSIAVGEAAAAECGELRLVHALPTTRTLNRARTPVLLYNSAQASPHPGVSATVTLPGGTAGLNRVVALLEINGRARTQSVYRGAQWPSAGPMRIRVGFAAPAEPTNLYRYTLQVTAYYANGTGGESAVRSSARGELMVLNRRDSPFGRGWWLAGLEQLVLDPFGAPGLWIGGDGSARRYTAVPGQSGTWTAPQLERPDTLRQTASGWVRVLGGGVRVEFDARGRHVATRNRLGHATRFGYDQQGRLESLTLPVSEGSTAPVYRFHYAGGRLQRVEAPALPQEPRTVRLFAGREALDSITDPDSSTVRFATQAGRITRRTDRRGVPTVFRYDAAGHLAASRLDLEGGDSIVHRLQSAQSRGLEQPVAEDSAFTLYDGPRYAADVLDHTRFWSNRWGAPERITDALGHTTVLFRTDARLPALVTRVEFPVHEGGQRVVEATYTARGQLQTQTEVNPYGDGRDAVTEYAYTDPQWPDFVTRITLPEGQVTTMEYDATTGHRLWQQDGRGDSTRVHFRYYSLLQPPSCPTDVPSCVPTPAAPPGLPRAVDPPLSGTDSLTYDALGNLREVFTPTGTTTYLRDEIGRPTEVQSPIDTLAGLYQRVLTRYDRLDRDTLRESIGPAMNGRPQQHLIVATRYDASGNPRIATRRVSPNPENLQPLLTQWRYNRAGWPVARYAEDGQRDSTVYDPAGNPVWTLTRRGDTLTHRYDARNQRVQRRASAVAYPARSDGLPSTYDARNPHCDDPDAATFPGPPLTHTYPLHPNDGACGYRIEAELATFAYDALGNLTEADNPEARVRRGYYPNGQLHTDTLRIQTLARDNWNAHVYGLEHRYNRNAQRTELHHPAQLAPVAGFAARYGYDPQFGALTSVTDPVGNVVQIRYDAESRRRNEQWLGSANAQQSYRYDSSSRVDVYQLRLRSEVGGLIENTTLTYDARDKLLQSRNTLGTQEVRTAEYSGLGHLAYSSQTTTGQNPFGQTVVNNATSRYWYDPLGNSYETTNETRAGTRSGNTWGLRNSTADYDPATARQVQLDFVENNAAVQDRFFYDDAGNQVFQTRAGFGSGLDRAYFYDALGQLRATDFRTVASQTAAGSEEKTVFEEARYDALGRRVWVRNRQWCDNTVQNTFCRYDTVRRTVWDGAHTLYQIQMPDTDAERETDGFPAPQPRLDGGFDPNPLLGRVLYTEGLQVDEPVSAIRMGFADHPSDTSTYRQ